MLLYIEKENRKRLADCLTILERKKLCVRKIINILTYLLLFKNSTCSIYASIINHKLNCSML